MFNIFKMFSKKDTTPKTKESLANGEGKVESINVAQSEFTKDISVYTSEALARSIYIKKEAQPIVLAYLLDGVDLPDEKVFLTVEEKRALGINTRLKMSKGIIDCLTDSGIKLKDPREALSSIHHQSSFAQTRDFNIERYRKIGVEEVQFQSAQDERDCDWCNKMNNELISIDGDLNQLINDNCKCESHCRAIFKAILPKLNTN